MPRCATATSRTVFANARWQCKCHGAQRPRPERCVIARDSPVSCKCRNASWPQMRCRYRARWKCSSACKHHLSCRKCFVVYIYVFCIAKSLSHGSAYTLMFQFDAWDIQPIVDKMFLRWGTQLVSAAEQMIALECWILRWSCSWSKHMHDQSMRMLFGSAIRPRMYFIIAKIFPGTTQPDLKGYWPIIWYGPPWNAWCSVYIHIWGITARLWCTSCTHVRWLTKHEGVPRLGNRSTVYRIWYSGSIQLMVKIDVNVQYSKQKRKPSDTWRPGAVADSDYLLIIER